MYIICILLCAGEVSVCLWDGCGLHSSLYNHHNQLRPHPEAPEADRVPQKDPQRETRPGYCGDVWHFLAAVPCHQHDAGVWGRVHGEIYHINSHQFLLLDQWSDLLMNTEYVLICPRWQLSGTKRDHTQEKCEYLKDFHHFHPLKLNVTYFNQHRYLWFARVTHKQKHYTLQHKVIVALEKYSKVHLPEFLHKVLSNSRLFHTKKDIRALPADSFPHISAL